jgi:hypothetical protein
VRGLIRGIFGLKKKKRPSPPPGPTTAPNESFSSAESK